MSISEPLCAITSRFPDVKITGVKEGKKHYIFSGLFARIDDTRWDVFGMYAIHLTGCLLCSVNWVDEDEERCHDGGISFVSNSTASASRPIMRRRAT